ncbi:dihydrolipoyl dehydrogenase [Lacrimispora sp. BS-2]|uniref:Dihydrolipoyl dehydrogenase n=1 Tax=Lacrimispora sp. BS-2 TaxID=3151850 RepID=A0AAU7PUF2_9FIRM
MEEQYDLIVIGAGPGGYVAAIKAAKLGMKTAVIENREVGGTCLNRGCVPAKAMLHAAKLYQEVLSGERFGIISKEVSYDYGKVMSYKNETSESLRLGVEQLLKGNKVERISGTGSLTMDGRVRVKTTEGEEILQAKHILLATGSKPALLPIEGIRLPGIMTSDEMFQLDHVPENLIIIGGGVIGVEFATVFSSFGSKVTLLEAEERLLPGLDKEISQSVKLLLKKRGVDIHTKAFVRKIEKEGLDFICTYGEKVKDKEKIEVLKTPYLLSATGRIPNTDGLLEEGTILKMDRGRIVVKENFETSMPGVFAIGDVIGGIQLAHAASSQGICAVEGMNGKEPSIDLSVVPSCVYTDPEIACVGITEEEAKEKGIETVTGKFLTHANSKSFITKEERGFVKVVTDKETGVLLGVQMMCARATDMIGEMGTAISNKLTAEQLLKAMRAHPTYNESVAEALEDCIGGAIHVLPRR